jgi:hypothetical protein
MWNRGQPENGAHMHDGGAGGGPIPGGGQVPMHHPGQLGHVPTHHHGHDGPTPIGYDHSASEAGIASAGRLSRRQTKAAALTAIAVIVIILIVLLVI